MHLSQHRRFSCGSSILVEWEFEDVGFFGAEENPEKTRSKERANNKLTHCLVPSRNRSGPALTAAPPLFLFLCTLRIHW